MLVDGKPCIYVFAVPNSSLLKIGSTAQPRKRLYQLRWGNRPDYAPENCHQGDFIAVVPLPSPKKAMSAERACQSALSKFRVRAKGRSGRALWHAEWFEIDVRAAVDALRAAADRFWPPMTKKGQMLFQFDVEAA